MACGGRRARRLEATVRKDYEGKLVVTSGYYFSEKMLEEIAELRVRLERTKGWLLRKAWDIALKELQAMKGPGDL